MYNGNWFDIVQIKLALMHARKCSQPFIFICNYCFLVLSSVDVQKMAPLWMVRVRG